MFLQIVTLFAVTLSVRGDGSEAISEQKVVIRHQPHNLISRVLYGQKKSEHHEEYARTYPSYEFSYKISDPDTKDMKGQHESRDGDKVKGTYWLVEPTGDKRTVKYSANDNEGFKARIRYLTTHKPPSEGTDSEGDNKKNDVQKSSIELNENSNEQNDKFRQDSMIQEIEKIDISNQNQKNQENNPINVLNRDKLQLGDQIQSSFETLEENNEDESQEDSSNDSKAKALDNTSSNEEMGDGIGLEADSEIKQIRHRINQNYYSYIHANRHNNGRKNDAKARDELKQQMENGDITAEKEHVNRNQNDMKRRNRIKSASNLNNSVNRSSNQRGTNNEVGSNTRYKEDFENFNYKQGSKRRNENKSVRNNLVHNKVKVSNNRNQDIRNKAPPNNEQVTKTEELNKDLKNKFNDAMLVLEDSRGTKDRTESIINIKNSKNSKEARANHYNSQLAEGNNIKYVSKKLNKDSTEEEIFEHHIVVHHS